MVDFISIAAEFILDIGFIIKKNITIAIVMKLINAFKNNPTENTLLFTVYDILEKSTFPAMPINGVIISETNAVITALNAVPMTTATARSNTLPFIINCLNSAAIDIKSTIHIRRRLLHLILII